MLHFGLAQVRAGTRTGASNATRSRLEPLQAHPFCQPTNVWSCSLRRQKARVVAPRIVLLIGVAAILVLVVLGMFLTGPG